MADFVTCKVFLWFVLGLFGVFVQTENVWGYMRILRKIRIIWENCKKCPALSQKNRKKWRISAGLTVFFCVFLPYFRFFCVIC